MKYFSKYPIKRLSWNKSVGGQVENFYLPETIDELIILCNEKYKSNEKFDIVGYTSNINFRPTYSPNTLISTRLLKQYVVFENMIVCECGVSVSRLSCEMVNLGVIGFEGLIDLPGTIASAVYGNAGCYNCSVSALLHSIDLLTPNGEIQNLSSDVLDFKFRSSAIKRNELKGVILRVYLYRRNGSVNELQQLSELYRKHRMKTQPGSSRNLGSIFVTGTPTFLCYLTKILRRVYLLFCSNELDYNQKKLKSRQFMLKCLGYSDISTYVEWGMNRFIWKDEKSYDLFDRYVKLYHKL